MVDPVTGIPSIAWWNWALKIYARTGGGIGIATTAATVLPVTVATLPLAPDISARAFVSDALAPVFGALVAGGGAVSVPVFFDGTAWRVG
jgi:hypothetical protein